MESILNDILAALRAEPDEPRIDSRAVQAIVRAHNSGLARNEDHYAKKQILPFYLGVKSNDPERWARWRIDADLEKRLLATLQVKPRRTASGVATITVITRPAPCGNACIYCPNDVRMPKSYLHDEPACQRAERNFFDPYLQVVSRARALHEMGHNIDKIELIVLGGTWCDYPVSYQTWFVRELFRACNDLDSELAGGVQAIERRAFYQELGLTSDPTELEARAASAQNDVTESRMTYNQAVSDLYGDNPSWQEAVSRQVASLTSLEIEQRKNESAAHRVVGFVVETRPDTISPERLALLRSFGCTKVQMGIQSLDARVLAANGRPTDDAIVPRALALARLFGFKLHTHFMVNLAGATPDSDRADYARFVAEPAYLPDEVKLYPCALVGGTGLCRLHEQGKWHPYTEEELLGVLCDDVLATPAYCRISRMIRDISAGDILVGNKKTNLRQMVEQRLAASEAPTRIREIRMREISTQAIDLATLSLEDVTYETAVSREHFLQWVTPEGKIAGFLRLSLPHADAIERLAAERDSQIVLDIHQRGSNKEVQESGSIRNAAASVGNAAKVDRSADMPSPLTSAFAALTPDAAMIREVHVYGRAAHLGKSVDGAQHAGLGRQLIARAESIARAAGYARLNVISSVGTREYYARQGFEECGLYQQKQL